MVSQASSSLLFKQLKVSKEEILRKYPTLKHSDSQAHAAEDVNFRDESKKPEAKAIEQLSYLG